MAARVGVRPTVFAGLALMVLASIVFAFASSIVVLDAARFVQGVGGAASWAGAMAWLAAAAPKDKRGQMIGSAMGAAIAGALLGPVIGVTADLAGFELVFCTIAAIGVGLMVWTLRTPAAKPLGDGSLRGLVNALGNGRVRTGLLLVTVPGLLFGTLSVLGPLRLDELGATTAAIGADLAGRRRPGGDRQPARRPLQRPPRPARAAARRPRRRRDHVRAAALARRRVDARDPDHRRLARDRPAVGARDVDAVRRRRRGRPRAGLAFGLMNLTWATGQSIGDVGGAHLGEAAGDEVAYLLLSAICVVAFIVLRTSSLRRPATA